MASRLVDRVDALGESHVELLPAYDARLFNHLRNHPLEGLVASLNTPNLLGAFQCCRIDADSFLGHCLTKDSTVV